MQTDKRKTIQKLNRILEKQKQCEKFYGVRKWNTLEEQNQLIWRVDAVKEQACPPDLWFDKEQHEFIMEMLDETQTKVEDGIKAKKRILKVWNENVFLPHNVRFAGEYVKVTASGLKYFSAQFWKHKKALRKLFLENDDLFTDDEIRILKRNLAILEESSNWLFFMQKKIVRTLGENYKGKETDFLSMRRAYDLFYTFIQDLVIQDKKFGKQAYENFLIWIQELKEIEVSELYREVSVIFKGMSECDFLHSDVKKLVKQYKEAAKMLPGDSEIYKKYGSLIWESKETKKDNGAELCDAKDRRKDIETVEDTELSAVLLKIMEDEGEITLDNIERFIARLLHYKRRTRKLNERVEDVIRKLTHEGKIARFSEGWRIIENEIVSEECLTSVL